MSKQIIPAQSIVSCDGCGKKCGHGPGEEWRKMRAVVTFNRCGLDILGDLCCDDTKVLDLCDKCARKLDEAMRTIFNEETVNSDALRRHLAEAERDAAQQMVAEMQDVLKRVREKCQEIVEAPVFDSYGETRVVSEVNQDLALECVEVITALASSADIAGKWVRVECRAQDAGSRIHCDCAVCRSFVRLMKERNQFSDDLRRLRAELESCAPAFIRAYTAGYKAGHHDTVEGAYIDVHHSESGTYFADRVGELIAEGTIPALSETDAQKGGE